MLPVGESPRIAKYCRLLTLLLSLCMGVILLVEYYFNSRGTSICKTSACEIVGHYVLFGENALVGFGVIFFFSVFLLAFYCLRSSSLLSWFYFSIILIALSFDSGILGFQFFIIEEKCTLCIGVALSILAIYILACLAKRFYLLIVVGIIFWTGSFFSTSILSIPENSGHFENMAFLEKPAIAAPSGFKKISQFTLIFSVNCSHCQVVLEYLSEQDTQNDTWKFALTDNDVNALHKTQALLQTVQTADNIFNQLLTLKDDQHPTVTLNKSQLKMLSKKSKSTRHVLANIGANGVPLLLVEYTDLQKRFLIGDTNIINFLDTYYSTE